MFRLRFIYIVILIFSILITCIEACSQPLENIDTATPIEVPEEGIPGEYINVILKVSSTQPCKLILATPHKTEIDNYLFPYTGETLTVPNSDGNVVFHERIPSETAPGNYILKVIQLKFIGDTEGIEIYSRTLSIRR